MFNKIFIKTIGMTRERSRRQKVVKNFKIKVIYINLNKKTNHIFLENRFPLKNNNKHLKNNELNVTL